MTRLRRRPRARARRGRGRDRRSGRQIGHAARADRPRCRASDNFWSVGGPGPCGPDSEIYYDWGEEHGCGEPDCAPGCTRCERFLEFWNLVFMEFELHADGTLTPLPKQNIDTGLGLERGARDPPGRRRRSTRPTATRRSWTGSPRESGVALRRLAEQATKAHRVLADHGRGMTFLVADGVTPSNEGRGYVLRRIIRRAVQQAQRDRARAPFLRGSPTSSSSRWARAYPGAARARASEIERRARAPRRSASRETLERGLKLFEELAAQAARSRGEDAFTLADTYGFPLELTARAGARARAAGRRGRLHAADGGAPRALARGRVRASSSVRPSSRRGRLQTEFVGYEKTEVLTADRRARGARRRRSSWRSSRESPFYPEGGGQVTDAGCIEHEETGARAELARRVPASATTRRSLFEGEGFAAGDRVRAVVPWAVRFPTMANHTATHLLHEALQRGARRARRSRPARRCGRTSCASTSRTRRR